MTNMITTTIDNAINSSLRFKQDIRNKIDQQIEASLASLFRWALSKRQVQQAIADQFEKSTPMCGVLQRAIEDAAPGMMGADEIGRLIEEALCGIEIEANQIEDFDREVKSVLDDYSSDIIDGVLETMAERMRK